MATILVEQEIRRLAVGCLHILYRRAIPDFPGSTRAAPSIWVHLALGAPGPLREDFIVWFPFRVWWKIWQRVAVPVITEFWNRDLSAIGSLDDLLALLIAELTNKLALEGFLPGDSAVEVPDFPPNPFWTGFYGNEWWIRLHYRIEDLS